MPAALEGADGEGVVIPGRGGDVDGVDADALEPVEVGDDFGSNAEEGFGLLRQRFGVRAIGIAGGCEVEGRQALPMQLAEPVEVAMPHAAASDDGETDSAHSEALVASGVGG